MKGFLLENLYIAVPVARYHDFNPSIVIDDDKEDEDEEDEDGEDENGDKLEDYVRKLSALQDLQIAH
jgi:hypothetical protein